MTNDELIARQAKENAELRDELSLLKERIASAKKVLYCIGGPLNDNKLCYSNEQLSTFFSISEALEGSSSANH